MDGKFNTTILIAPLDWGLGHAARCIPLIRYMVDIGCIVIIATEGPQKKLLQTEFPNVKFLDLGGYNITYTRDKRFFSLKIMWQLPKLLRAVRKEKAWLNSTLKNHHIHAIISDNRYGLWHPKIPAVFITHQLNIQVPFIQNWVRKLNYSLINYFSFCWVPDTRQTPGIAGELSHPTSLPHIPTHYLGGLSRFEKKPGTKTVYDLLIIISGPEPQRLMLENKILLEVKDYDGKVLFVRGLPADTERIDSFNDVTIENHLSSDDLNLAFSQSELIISRSGYTTVMDILKLGKKSILIPTPGQTEQEYLARHLKEQQWCLSFTQSKFNLKEAVSASRSFNYKVPCLSMNDYKPILDEFISRIRPN